MKLKIGVEDDERYFGRSITAIELEALLVNTKVASSIREFCSRYQISRGTFYAEIKRGNLTVRKIGARSLIMADDERDWVKNMRALPAHPLTHSGTVVKGRQRRTMVDSGKQ